MPRTFSLIDAFHREMRDFADFGTATTVLEKPWQGRILPVYVNEFWTAKQRAAHSLHEVSYRACFKPQLPRFSSNASPVLAKKSMTRSWGAAPRC